jgi:hypothetical protein
MCHIRFLLRYFSFFVRRNGCQYELFPSSLCLNLVKFTVVMGFDGSVSKVTGCGLEGMRSIPSRGKYVSLAHHIQTDSGVPTVW